MTIYFTPKERVMLFTRLGRTVPNTDAIKTMKLDADEFKARQKKGRDSRLKSDVLGGYFYLKPLHFHDHSRLRPNAKHFERHKRQKLLASQHL